MEDNFARKYNWLLKLAVVRRIVTSNCCSPVQLAHKINLTSLCSLGQIVEISCVDGNEANTG